MDVVIPPIIVDEHGDIAFYQSLSQAAADLEAVDVQNGEYEVFDSVGRVIRAEADDRWGPVRLAIATELEPAPDLLADKLRRFVATVGPKRVGFPHELSTATLEVLVGALSEFFGTD